MCAIACAATNVLPAQSLSPACHGSLGARSRSEGSAGPTCCTCRRPVAPGRALALAPGLPRRRAARPRVSPSTPVSPPAADATRVRGGLSRRDERSLERRSSARRRRDDVGFIRVLLDSLRRELPVDPRADLRDRHLQRRGYGVPPRLRPPRHICGDCAGGRSTRRRAGEPLRGRRTGVRPHVPGHRRPADAVRRRRPEPSARAGARRRPRRPTLFAQVNGCTEAPVVAAQPDTVTDGTRVRRSTYSGCRDGRDVVLFTIEGGGHTWPGGPPVGRSVGRVTRDLDATRVMLDFFDRHPQ